MLAISDKFDAKQLSTPKELELITVEIYCKTTVTMCLIYNPPNASEMYHSSLLKYLQSLSEVETLVLLGDLNLPNVH